MRSGLVVVAGIIAVMAETAIWHGPLGAGERLASQTEARARRTLDYYELPQVQARLQRHPLSRRLMLTGPADDFQRAELIRILDRTPGVVDVRWDPTSLPQEGRTQ